MAVVGLGLMGGSLARALRSAQPRTRILGVDLNSVTGTRALNDGLVDRFGLPGEGLPSEAQLVVLASPIRAALQFLEEEAPHLPPETLITDVSSLNAPLLKRAEVAGVAQRYVSAHPMAGSEESGLAHARGDLYQDATVWLSASDAAGPEVRKRISAFWTALGAAPRWIEAGEHDRTMAWVSHLPQLLSSALAGALDSAGMTPADLGPGGRDMTRLAGSSSRMWTELLEFSAPVTGTGLTSVSRALSALADLLARREMDRVQEFLELTRSWARAEDSLSARAEADQAEPSSP